MLNTNPINPALWKPHNLIMGANRVLFVMLAIATAIMILALRNWLAYIAVPIMFYSILKLLQKLAKKDPLFLSVVSRHLSQQKYYPAGGSYPGYPNLAPYGFNIRSASRTKSVPIFWLIFYFLFPTSVKAPKSGSSGSSGSSGNSNV